MTLLGLAVLVAGALVLLAREVAAVRLDDVRDPSLGAVETAAVVVASLVLVAPRMVELLT